MHYEKDDPLALAFALRRRRDRSKEPWTKATRYKFVRQKSWIFPVDRRMKTRWSQKEDFLLIDIDHDYYVIRLLNLEEYDHMLT